MKETHSAPSSLIALLLCTAATTACGAQDSSASDYEQLQLGLRRSELDGSSTLSASPAREIVLTASPVQVAVLGQLARQPEAPTARLTQVRPNANDPTDDLIDPAGRQRANECLVDFSDYDALDRLTYAPTGYFPYAEDTFTWSPWWFQQCAGPIHAVVRPLGNWDHYHLNYEDPDIGPCEPFGEWGYPQPDGSCDDFDPRDKDRSISTHDPESGVHLYTYDGSGKLPFSLKRITVLGNSPLRLCYRPDQVVSGDWITSEADGTTFPGIWYCWDSLDPGWVWDLSQYANNVTDVKFYSADGLYPAKADDITISTY